VVTFHIQHIPCHWNFNCWASKFSIKTVFCTKCKWKRTNEKQLTIVVCTNFFKLQDIIHKALCIWVTPVGENDNCIQRQQPVNRWDWPAKIFNLTGGECVNMMCSIKYLPSYLLSTCSKTPECIRLCISCIACWNMFNKKSSHEAGTQFLYIISLMAPIARVPIFWCSSWDIP
jgi:hypothetical protein